MGKLFGTDGVRDIAGAGLTCELAMRIGQAVAEALVQKGTDDRRKVVLGKDTRASSDMLEQAVAAGLTSRGVDVVLVGVISTPAVAFLCDAIRADAGVVISASHNTYEHNGIKVFAAGGRKLTDAQQQAIETLLEQPQIGQPCRDNAVGRVYYHNNAAHDYVEHLAKAADGYFDDFKVVVDAANGAASSTIHLLAKRLAMPCVIINDQPDGSNINHNCGSTSPEMLAEAVRTHRARVGVAFDGDADRILAVDEKGEIIDGDRLMAIFATYLKEQGQLKNDKIAVTIMSNLGLTQYLKSIGVSCVQTAVGDRNVLEAMEKEDLVLGGEQSGHIILGDYAGTGDGQLAMVFLLRILREKRVFLSRLAGCMTRYPQLVINVPVHEDTKTGYADHPDYKAKVKEIAREMGDDGRVLIRPSGTEQLLRVMVEGADMEKVNRHAVSMAELLRRINKEIWEEGREEDWELPDD
ncbi:MAG: phosphoglucosamine mutase [Clostridia bacterium]|nr:phosphoglucosamine mutase [Clostridia bacterium]